MNIPKACGQDIPNAYVDKHAYKTELIKNVNQVD